MSARTLQFTNQDPNLKKKITLSVLAFGAIFSIFVFVPKMVVSETNL